jgi:ectoine hydroxylase-related dioxygenase (phytanoyl-CoA dioxygenase family)
MKRRRFIQLMSASATLLAKSWSKTMATVDQVSSTTEPGTFTFDAPALARFTRDLDTYGFVVIPDLISRADAEFAAERIVQIMKQQPEANAVDQHLSNIVDLLQESDYPVFARILAHPVCLEIAEHVLGKGVQLTEPGARWKKPGAPAGPMHPSAPLGRFAEWGLPVPNNSFVLPFSWMLNDLKSDMGATAYIPFSHLSPRYGGPEEGRQYVIPVEGAAGSVVFYHQALWHCFAPNTSKDRARVGFMGGYCAAWVDPVAVGYHLMKKRVYARMPEAVQHLNKRIAPE